MKKAVSLLISLVILLSAFTAIPVHAEGETHKVIIHSAQGLFEDAYADFSSGDIFNVGVNLKSDCQLSQGQFVVKYDPDVFIVSQNFTTDFTFPDPVVNLQNGEFTMVFDSVNQLVNTLSGGNFITFKVKALSTFTSDQTFTFDFQLLEGGRYKSDTDSFGDPRTYIDPSFAKLYIEKSQVKLPGLKVAPHFNEEESVENDEPGTMTATLSNTGYSFGNENWYAYTWTDGGSKWRWVKLGDDNVATGLHENVIFCRVDKNASSPSFDYVWNQTEDLKTKDGGTFTITSWNEGAYGNLSGYWDESDSTFATTVTDAAAASAPSTAALTTAAPTGTDPAETTAAPSTAATTAQNQTTDSNINRITVTSTQGLFEDVSENFAANNNFELTIKLKTSYPLSQGTVSMKFDPTQLTVYDRYTSPYTLPDDLVNVTDKGEFVLLFSSITTLVDTTNGGTFFTIRGKTNDAFTGDQKIEVNFDTLIGGRFVTEYDPVFQEYNTYIDKDFDYTYTEFSEVRNHELEVEAVLTNLSGAPATSPTQAPTQTDPTESATPAPTTAAPTTVAPTTVAPTTVAPTTAAPTTVAPTTVAPTTAAPTGAAGTHKVTVKSPQGIFSDASAYVTPGEMFTIRIELKTEFPLSDATFAATYDPNQVLVGAYSTSLKMPTPTTNRLNGEYRFVLGTGAELVDTTNGGEFVTLKVKAQSAMDSDQIININFETLRSGRYNTVYDEWNEEYVQIVDPTFEQLYIAFNEVKNTDFDMKVYINWTGEQPTTAAPTTVAPTTVAPTTVAPTTAAPTTVAPTTAAPTTVAPTTAAPTTVAPTTAAPTTVAPTTAAPTTAAPTTVAPTTATPTSGDGSYKITVKSPQGIFTEASARIMPGEMFTIRIELKTEFPLSDATFAATYDPNQVLVGAYSTSLKMPTPTTNRLNGEYRFVLGTGAELVETTNGGEFVTLKAKTLDTMNSDQIINLDFETLRSGRYNTVYDEWNEEYVQIVDPTFEQLYIAFDEVKNTDFDMKVYINWTGEQPTTAAPTTVAPTTVAPTTVAPTTVAPTTVAPTTVAPTTVAPTTVAPTTVAPTTVAPTTVAPTTVAPTTLAPTTVAPTTVAPTTAEPTTQPTTAAPTPSPDGKYQLTVRSAQNMFTPFSKRFEPGEEFAIGIKINTSRPIKGCNLTALFDQTQVSVDSYATTKQMTPFTSKYSGKYNFVVGSAGELIDPSGEFIMLRGKCLNEFNTNQEIILDFTYLIVGNLQDPDYEQYFVADGVMLSHDFSVRAYFTEYVEPQPTTAEPTTLAPTTAEPTTLAPTTAEPTTLAPTTAEPTTFKPTETVTEPTETATQTEPISTQPGTETTTVTEATEATTALPTEATTAGPVVPTDATEAPSTAEPTTQPTEATTAQPTEATTAGPVVPTDATEAPSTAEPTAQPTEATTALPTEATTAEPTTEIPTTAEPTTQPTEATTAEPTTEAPTTQPETTTPATQAPTQAPTKAPATQPTTAKKIDNLDGNPNSDSAVDYVKNLKNDKDPKGSTFGLLRANSKKVTKNSIKVTWKKLKGAKKYIIMGNKCGKSYKKITTTTKLSFTQKKLRKGTYYKYMILAVNAKNKVIAVSKTLHVATKGGKVGNYKSVKITNAKSTLTLKKGKKMKLKAKAIKADKKVRNHRKIKFESSKPSVVKITAGGKLTAKKKGTAIIYAYAQNGVFKKIKVKVK